MPSMGLAIGRQAVVTYLFLLLNVSLTGFYPHAWAESQNDRIIKAIQAGNVSVVEQALEKGLNPNQRIKANPLIAYALNSSHIAITRLLLANKADYEAYAFTAALKGHEHIITHLYTAGARLHDIRNREGETLLMVSAKQGNAENVKQLTEKGSDVNAQSNKGHSAMTYASRYGHLSIVKYLLNHGAEVNIANNNGWTPLLKAARGGHLKVVDYLLAHDADIQSRNTAGHDALLLAKRYKHDKVVKYLKHYK